MKHIFYLVSVVIWDDSQGDPNKSVVMDITFAQPVTAVRLKKDRYNFRDQHSNVQSIVSLTSLLRGQLVKCFMTLKPTTLIYFFEKMRKAFALQSFSHFFNKKYWHI